VKNADNIFRLQCEPRSCASHTEHHTQLIEYDVRMRQEEEKYSQRLAELKKTRWFVQSDISQNNEPEGFMTMQSDRIMKESQLSELEMTRLTGDEILHGSELTMDQVLLMKQKPFRGNSERTFGTTRTQSSIMFQSTITQRERNDSLFWYTASVELSKISLQKCNGVCKKPPYSIIQMVGNDKINHIT
jgi:hypothetical protein